MGKTGENHRPKVTDKLYLIMLYRVHLTRAGFELSMLMVIGTDSIGSCKSTTIRPRPTPWLHAVLTKVNTFV